MSSYRHTPEQKIKRQQRMLKNAVDTLRDLYPDETHFVYELIQNANDALARIDVPADGDKKGIHIVMREQAMLVWNNGRPFDDEGIEAICSIGDSTKDLTQIGTHGIGFKAVYSCTDQPEVYSGGKNFKIIDGIEDEPLTELSEEAVALADTGKTVFRFPFREDFTREEKDRLETRTETLHTWTLLFLRNIDCIKWSNERNGKQGAYHCSRYKYSQLPDIQQTDLDISVEKVDLEGMTFLVFRRDVYPPPDVIEDLLHRTKSVTKRERIQRSANERQPVEIAFTLHGNTIVPVQTQNCVLFAYLPTEIETHLRFVVQARYQTTPGRDSIKSDLRWNRWLVEETAKLIPAVLSGLKSMELLTPTFFECLPTSSEYLFPFCEPIRDACRNTLASGQFIPVEEGGYLAPHQVRYPHNQSARYLFTSADLKDITDGEATAWLHPDIEQNERAFQVVKEAGVRELPASRIITWLNTKGSAWFESRDDVWLCALYAYLSRQTTEVERIKSLALVRLTTGKHCCAETETVFFEAEDEGQKDTLLPFLDNMPFLRMSLLNQDDNEDVKRFLIKMGVKPLKPLRFLQDWLLPKYQNKVAFSNDENRVHVHFIMDTLDSVSVAEASTLRSILRDTPFLLAWCNGKSVYASPSIAHLPQAYTGTDDLGIYFASTTARLVDECYISPDRDATRLRDFFKRLGVNAVPRRLKTAILQPERRMQVINEIECKSSITEIEDWQMDGLEIVLKRIAAGGETAVSTSLALWNLLKQSIPKDAAERQSFLRGKCKWFYRKWHYGYYDATFYHQLKTTEWLPDENRVFRLPSALYLGTKENRQVLGNSVHYLHPDIVVGESSSDNPARMLAQSLEVHLTADVDAALRRLQSLSGKTVDVKEVENIYRFLHTNRTNRQYLFAAQPLIYTPNPYPQWWTVSQVFWSNEEAVFEHKRGYLQQSYTEDLKPFFLALNVKLNATFTDYVQAIQEIALQNDVTEPTRERLYSLYRHIEAELLIGSVSAGGNREHEQLWQQLRNAKCWLGCKGDEWAFYTRTELVCDDHNYNADLFDGLLPFWIFRDLERLTCDLEITCCSQARFDFQPQGERNALDVWTQKIRSLAALIADFCASPKFNRGKNYAENLDLLEKMTIIRIEEAKVSYYLNGVSVSAKHSRSSYLQVQESNATLWLTQDADELDYPHEIGDAMEQHFEMQQMREFLSDFLQSSTTTATQRILTRWQQRGLQYRRGQPPIAFENATTVGEETDAVVNWQEDSGRMEEQNINLPAAGEQPNMDTQIQIPELLPERSESTHDAQFRENDVTYLPDAFEPIRDIGIHSNHERGERTPGFSGFGSGGGGEGDMHLALKQKIAQYPSLCGEGLTLVTKEYIFLSLDEVDVLLQDVEGKPHAVEVKPYISKGDYKGVWQAVKYKHLLAVERGLPCAEVRSILVAPRIPDDVQAECRKLGIEPIEISMP